MSEKTKKVSRASWLGMMIDIWSVVDTLSCKVRRYAATRVTIYTREQDALLLDVVTKDMGANYSSM